MDPILSNSLIVVIATHSFRSFKFLFIERKLFLCEFVFINEIPIIRVRNHFT